MQSHLLRSTASYKQFAEGKWDKVSRKLIRQGCTKRTWDISSAPQTKCSAALGLITTALQRGEESRVPMIQNLSSPKALVLGHYWPFQTGF